jgi:hypothetical protein
MYNKDAHMSESTIYPARPYPRLADVQAKVAYDGMMVKELAAKAGLGYGYVVRLLNGYSYSERAVEKLRVAVGLSRDTVCNSGERSQASAKTYPPVI